MVAASRAENDPVIEMPAFLIVWTAHNGSLSRCIAPGTLSPGSPPGFVPRLLGSDASREVSAEVSIRLHLVNCGFRSPQSWRFFDNPQKKPSISVDLTPR
jgi:hypothetical protein